MVSGVSKWEIPDKVIGRIYSFVDDIKISAAEFKVVVKVNTEGPDVPFTWCHKGVVLQKEMPAKARRLAKYLFDERPKLVDFRDLEEPVFQEHGRDVDYNMVSTPRTKANEYFKENGIPWQIVTVEKKYARIIFKKQQEN